MIAGHIEIQAVTEDVRDIVIDLIRLKDLIADQSSQPSEDEKAVIYNEVESVSRRIGHFPDRLQSLWVQWKAGLDATKKANRDATESLVEKALERMQEVDQREIDLAKDAEDFEGNKKLADEKLKEAVEKLRAVGKREKLVAVRERRMADLEEVDAFKKSFDLGMDGAVDDESEVDVVLGNGLPIASAEVKGNSCSTCSSKGTFGVPENKFAVTCSSKGTFGFPENKLAVTCSSKGTFGIPENKLVVDRDLSVESSKEEQAFEHFDLGTDGTMEHAADAGAAHANEYLDLGADAALEDLASAEAAHQREIERLNSPSKNDSSLAQEEDAAETAATTPSEQPPDGTCSIVDAAFLREESLAAREEKIFNREVRIDSKEKQIWAREHLLSAREQEVTQFEERFKWIKMALRWLDAGWIEQMDEAFRDLDMGLGDARIDAMIRAEEFKDELRLLIKMAKKLAGGGEGMGRGKRGGVRMLVREIMLIEEEMLRRENMLRGGEDEDAEGHEDQRP